MKHYIFVLLFLIAAPFLFSCNSLLDVLHIDDIVYNQQDTVIHFNVDFEYEWEGINRNFVDRGVLLLPKNYRNNDNTTTSLVIYCHSGGGSVHENTSECEQQEIVKYLVSCGYAVFSMASMPDALATELEIDQFRTVGSDIALKATIAGYSYIIDKYIFYNNYLLSNSNGGLLASNLVNFSNIPFKAQAGIAPLLSIENNAWSLPSSSMSGGKYQHFQNRANIIALFHMAPCNSQQELDNKEYEKDKVGDYDPFDYYVVERKKKYNVPYLIFSCVGDGVVLYDIAKVFADTINDTGSYSIVDTTTSLGAHNVKPNPIIVGTFSYQGKDYPINEVFQKTVNFYKQYN